MRDNKHRSTGQKRNKMRPIKHTHSKHTPDSNGKRKMGRPVEFAQPTVVKTVNLPIALVCGVSGNFSRFVRDAIAEKLERQGTGIGNPAV
jgi:hypothetical protein